MSQHDPYAAYIPFREQLDNWQKSKPDNFYGSDANLKSSLDCWLGEDAHAAAEAILNRAGADAATILNDLATETNRDENLPVLRRFDGNGNRTEEIVFHPGYHEIGRRMYGSGIMQMYDKPGRDILQLAMFYLFVQNGEAGHCCPLACTAGSIKLLQRAGNQELKDRFLPQLLNPDYDTHLHASQFLTELQGGSDVGANTTVAVPEGDGSYKLYGEKWFCSVIDAGLFVLTARPEGEAAGTRGLTTFVAPRHFEDGSPNYFEVKRLKYKIGTRSMASAEIDLNGLVAWPVGDAGEGFKHVVDIVLNTSRLYNGFAAAGATHRAYMEALTFAKTREAFGHAIADYPLIQRSLAFLRTENALQLASSMHVAKLAAKIADGSAEDEERAAFRFLVNTNKYTTSINCTRAVREAIEVFGGNGTIEEFSVLPRLYRDAIVLESWEGTHNVLCMQVLRDMAKYGVHKPVLAHAEKAISSINAKHLKDEAETLKEKLSTITNHADELISMQQHEAQLHVRHWIDEAMKTLMAIDLLTEAQSEANRGIDTGKADALAYHIQRNVLAVKPFGNNILPVLEERLATTA